MKRSSQAAARRSVPNAAASWDGSVSRSPPSPPRSSASRSSGFILGPLLAPEPDVWRAVGAVDSFKPGETVKVKFLDPSPVAWAGVTAMTAAWLRRLKSGGFVAFAVNCSHLGCPVRWLAQANLFMCPCHGGVYYADGNVAAGPPPRRLFNYPVRVRDGQVEILASAVPIE